MSLKLKKKIFISTKTELTNGVNQTSNISFNFANFIKKSIEDESDINEYFEVFLADPNQNGSTSLDYWEICKNNILTADFLIIVLLDKKATLVRKIDLFPEPTTFMEEEIKSFIDPNKWKDLDKKTYKINERIISIISTNIAERDINNFTPSLKTILKKYNRLAPPYNSNNTSTDREKENREQIISNLFLKLRTFISKNKQINYNNNKSSKQSYTPNVGSNIEELVIDFQKKYLMNTTDQGGALVKSQFQLLIRHQANTFQKQNILDREDLVKVLETFGKTLLNDLSNDSYSKNSANKPLDDFILNYLELDKLVRRVDDIPLKKSLVLFQQDLEQYSNAFMNVKENLEKINQKKYQYDNSDDLLEDLIEHFSVKEFIPPPNSQIGFKPKKYNLFVTEKLAKLVQLNKSFEKYEAIKTVDVPIKYFFKFQLPFITTKISKKIVNTFFPKSITNNSSPEPKNNKKDLYNPKKNSDLANTYKWIGEALKLPNKHVLNKLGAYYAIAKQNERLIKIINLHDWSEIED
jgi:hypothetical protein